MTNDFQRINIAVKIPQEISEEVVKLSGEIGKDNQAYFIWVLPR